MTWNDVDEYVNFITGEHIGRHPGNPPLVLVISAEREARRQMHQRVRRLGESMSQAMLKVREDTSMWNWHFFQP